MRHIISSTALLSLILSCLGFNFNAYAANVSHVHGDLGESFMHADLKEEGWEKLNGEVGRNGFDGLHIKRTKAGMVKQVLISESKFGGGTLGEGCGVTQMSHKWVVCVKDKLKKNNQKAIDLLEKKRSKSNLSKAEEKKLKSLIEEKKDLEQIEKHITAKNYRRRIFKTNVKKGTLKITSLEIDEKNGIVIEKEIPNKKPREISLKNPPKSGSARKVYNNYFKNLESTLNTKGGMTKGGAEKTVRELKQAYLDGDVVNEAGKKGQAEFLKKRMVADLNHQIKHAPNLAKKMTLMARKRLLIHSDKMGKIFKPYWFLGGIKKSHKLAVGHRSIRYTKGIITRSGKLLVKVPKGVVAGTSAGLAIVAFEAGDAYIDFAKGQILRPELEKRIADATVKGGVVLAGTAVAIALGSNPAGFVVLAIGIGGYMITDLVVEHWHQYHDRQYLTDEDLKFFGLTMSDTIPLRMDKWNPDIPLNIENWGR